MPSPTNIFQGCKSSSLSILHVQVSAFPSSRPQTCQFHGNDCDCPHSQIWSCSGPVSHGSTAVLIRVQTEIRCISVVNAIIATRAGRLKTTSMTIRWPTLCPKLQNKQTNLTKANKKNNTAGVLKNELTGFCPTQKLPANPQNKMKSRYVINTHYNLHFRGTGVNS